MKTDPRTEAKAGSVSCAVANHEATAAKSACWGKGAFSVLVVDPPWSYGSDSGRPNRTAEAHYKTIGHAGKEINRKTGAGVQGIIDSVPVKAWAAPDAHLYLWTTNPKLPFAFAVMDAWGFEYKTTLSWVKTQKGGALHCGGMGWFFRGATEHVLFGVRGRKPIPSGIRKPNVVFAPPVGHSVKPDAFYDMVDGLYDEDEPKIDVFARRWRLGWTSYGDELGLPEPSELLLGLDGVVRSNPARMPLAEEASAISAAGTTDPMVGNGSSEPCAGQAQRSDQSPSPNPSHHMDKT